MLWSAEEVRKETLYLPLSSSKDSLGGWGEHQCIFYGCWHHLYPQTPSWHLSIRPTSILKKSFLFPFLCSLAKSAFFSCHSSDKSHSKFVDFLEVVEPIQLSLPHGKLRACVLSYEVGWICLHHCWNCGHVHRTQISHRNAATPSRKRIIFTLEDNWNFSAFLI